MNRLTNVLAAIVLLLFAGAPGAMAGPTSLTDWGFNLNGTRYVNPCFSCYTPPDPGFLPNIFNTSAFDFGTGLGSITVTFNPGAVGDYFFVAYFDHEIANDGSSGSNGAYNEYGAYPLPPSIFNPDGRVPAAGQSWQIDDPLFGTVFDNFKANTLDGQNHQPSPNPGDVAMALGWNFHIADPAIAAVIRLDLTTTGAPASPLFYLSHHDDLNDAVSGSAGTDTVIYFSSDISGAEVNTTVPEPGTLLLLGGIVAALGVGRKFRR